MAELCYYEMYTYMRDCPMLESISAGMCGCSWSNNIANLDRNYVTLVIDQIHPFML